MAIPRDQLAIAQPSELIVDVLGRTGAGDGRVIVLDGDRVVGIVTPSDVTTALERLSLAREWARCRAERSAHPDRYPVDVVLRPVSASSCPTITSPGAAPPAGTAPRSGTFGPWAAAADRADAE